MQFALYHASTGRQMTEVGAIDWPQSAPSTSRIAIDALEVVVRAGNIGDATCSSACMLLRCGNNVIDSAIGESCDDGNANAGDGCDDRCAPEICALPSP